jgi:protein AATF/BFR2
MSLLFSPSSASSGEASRSAAEQFKGYEHLLALRIALQKLLDEGNKFPVSASRADSIGNGIGNVGSGGAGRGKADVDVRAQLSGFSGVSRSIQACLQILSSSLVQQSNPGAPDDDNEEETEAASSAGSKRARDKGKKTKGRGKGRGSDDEDENDEDSTSTDPNKAWERIYAAQKRLQPAWESSVNLWHSRLHYGSEKVQSKFRTFNQSLWEGVDAAIQDEDKCISKSRAQLGQSTRVDRPQLLTPQDQVPVNEDTAAGSDSESGSGSDSGSDKESKGKRKGKSSSGQYDMQTYDDRAFYSLLLKAYIMSGTSTGDMNTADGLAMLRQYKKRKADVDRRASKGRKLRYVVHKKLQNFMFPHEAPQTGMDVDRLLQSLFQ